MVRDKTEKTSHAAPRPIGFHEAVGIAKQILTEERRDEAGRDLYSWAEYKDAICARTAPLFSGSIMIGDLRGTKTEIIDFASSFDLSDPVHYEVCCEMLAGKIQAGEPVPPDFRDFAAALIRCFVPDDHIDPRRSALFMARLVLREIRDGGTDACSTA